MTISPCFCSLRNRLLRMLIEPVLVFVNACNPGQATDDVFQLFTLCTFQVFFVSKKQIPMLHAYQFHAHGSNLSHFRRQFLEIDKIKIMIEDGMNSVTSLVHHGYQIAKRRSSIHKNKRNARFIQRIVKSSGRFANTGI